MKDGDYVHYLRSDGAIENGRIKSIAGDHAFVVYRCNGNWDDYLSYTGASTLLTDLRPGWKEKKSTITQLMAALKGRNTNMATGHLV